MSKVSVRKRPKTGRILIFLGCCCILVAAAFYIRNQLDAGRAATASEQLTERLSLLLAESAAPVPAPEDARDAALLTATETQPVAAVPVGGYDVSGILAIPAIDIRLAVISEWSYPNLDVSACRYSGAPDAQMILLAHNYPSHFGKLGRLAPGDTVSYTDVEGVVYTYAVTETEQWATEQLSEIISGDDWDLTLFTCTYTGRDRVVIRCIRTESN